MHFPNNLPRVYGFLEDRYLRTVGDRIPSGNLVRLQLPLAERSALEVEQGGIAPIAVDCADLAPCAHVLLQCIHCHKRVHRVCPTNYFRVLPHRAFRK
jgi:hypothetical protein